MNKNKDNSILTGSISGAILTFFFPILIGTLFQQLYNTVDAAVVGQFAGTDALSSVGGSSAIVISLVVGFFTGLSAGCTVLISQYYGAGDRDLLDRALHTSYAFAIVGGLIFGVLAIIFTPAILHLMNTPENLMASSTIYLRVYFAGLVFIFVYNMGSAILRALGDSKRPLIYLIIGSVVNIVFDLLFVAVFHMEALGAALATLLAQVVSAVLVTHCLMRKTKDAELRLRDIRFDMPLLGKMIKIGLPSGIQSSSYALSNMFIQSAVNLFGVATMAGYTVEGKVDIIFWMINGSFGIAAATFVGQNYGANQMERVRKGTATCFLMAMLTAVVVIAFLLTFGKYMLRIFTTDTEVIEIGAHLISIIAPGYWLFVFIEIFSSALRARGNTLVPTIINLVCIIGIRVAWIAVFKQSMNLDLVIFCYPLSWAVCALVMTIYYLYARNRLPVRKEPPLKIQPQS